jgi:hypothetical protein
MCVQGHAPATPLDGDGKGDPASAICQGEQRLADAGSGKQHALLSDSLRPVSARPSPSNTTELP